ncbi:hypothetical protein H1W37_19325 [Stappia taiwanensis]|uniref:Uncharacterized protein n=1 Tax=Stappia taiwanensis TaxID=992267 RepID=A0A838XTQ5_9HYPH|nr:hypothetical protein [Stappia taiwanensis]MBA4613815.1 hypothetical protein [Stappia taiwanensis]GGE79320.1 hypothetical protein GCM10007285_03930 [Stappia taiwanensis]
MTYDERIRNLQDKVSTEVLIERAEYELDLVRRHIERTEHLIAALKAKELAA